MSDNLRPYPEYQDSGVDWLGEIPVHWEVYPHRSLFTEIIERGYPDEQMLSVTIARGVLPQSQLLASSSKKDSSNTDKSTYKLVSEDDIAYNKMRAWQGAIGASAYRGIISPAYIIVRLREEQNNIWYFHYLFRTPLFTTEAERWSYGITSDQWSLRYGEFKQIYSPLPPPDEQATIVTFLDVAEKRIRRYIRAKQKLIKLLNEQKQAIIQQAVTRGLDPDAPMKDSGVEWLGEIPAGWEEKPAKYYYCEIDIRSKSGEEELLSVSHITGVTPRNKKNITMFKSASYVGSKICEHGDLVINTMWAWMGAMGVARQTGIISPSYSVYRPLEENNFLPDFSDYLLRVQPYISEYICRSTGIRSSRLRLYPDKFLSIPIVRPPLDEQQAIVDYVENETSTLNHYLSNAETQIDLIREYRTRLIADVVTGKVDVRGVAFEMPEAFEEDDLLDVDEDELLEEDDLEEVFDGED